MFWALHKSGVYLNMNLQALERHLAEVRQQHVRSSHVKHALRACVCVREREREREREDETTFRLAY